MSDVRAQLKKKEFTPGAKHFDELFALLVDDDDKLAGDAERALQRAGEAVMRAAAARLAKGADVPLRARLARLAARIGGDSARGLAMGLLGDADARVRRAAVSALGKLGGAGVADALLARWPVVTDAAERRALAGALGKLGDERAAPLLAALDPGDDVELARLGEKARLMLARDVARVADAGVDLTRATREPVRVRVRCRGGLASLLAEELRELASAAGRRAAWREVKVVAAEWVEIILTGAPAALLESRLWLDFGFDLGQREASGDKVIDAVVDLLTSRDARAVFAGWTSGPARFRVEWTQRGPSRAMTWRLAAMVAERAPELVNDPREAPWEAQIGHDAKGRVRLLLAPRRFEDPRFAYRVGDVPAASNPTLAAALARVAGVRADDVVWDPFCGSGSELIERARLGPFKSLAGTDIDPQALSTARANLAAAGVKAELVRDDATVHIPQPAATLIISNPPMGLRVHRGVAGPLLERFVAHAARCLAPGGRLVWLTPAPAKTDAIAARAGFKLDDSRDVDMGGFSARLQRLIKTGA